MTTFLLNSNAIDAFSKATSPEGAAQIFLEAASKGMAKVMAEALDQALTKAVVDTANVSGGNITGWNDLIKGCVVDLCWERPKLGLPVGQVVTFCERKTNGVNALGVGVSVGITISGTF
ncbi:MAG: hypothetical protein ACK418_15710 [Pseudomonas sp.]|uniref:hypothetical protein n=1 Tax=Pseudomonas sp. TaxID=306 RepID=UPI00391D49A4